MQPIDVSRYAVEVVADLLARASTGETRNSDGLAQELQVLVEDRLRATDPGAAAMEQLVQDPTGEPARQAATVALATAASFDPELSGLLGHKVTAVHWLWQHEAAGPGAAPPEPQAFPVAGTRTPRRRRTGIVVAAVVAGLVLLGGGGAAAYALLGDRALVTLATGTWDCEYTQLGGVSMPNFTALVDDGRYELRAGGLSGSPISSGSWELDGRELRITEQTTGFSTGPRSWQVDRLPGSADQAALLDVLSDQDGQWQVRLRPFRDGEEIELKSEIDGATVRCVKRDGAADFSAGDPGEPAEPGGPGGPAFDSGTTSGDLSWDDGQIRVDSPGVAGADPGPYELTVTNYTGDHRTVTVDYACARPEAGVTRDSPVGFVLADVPPYGAAAVAPDTLAPCTTGQALYITSAGHTSYDG